MISNIIVLGAGSAGLIAAISLRRKLPQCGVRVVRSPDIGVIGVGEGTTPIFQTHLFESLGISRARFYALAEPTWKIGIHFLWGPRDSFDYSFSQQPEAQWSDLPRPHGFYCDDEFRSNDLPAALMAHGKAFARQPHGNGPDIQPRHGFHIENKKLVEVLEIVAGESGVEFTDATVKAVERGPQGVAALILADGERLSADFYIDSSGFRSELLGRALEEPFVSYDRSLFCDRAVVGGWERTNEPILPYTTAETMDAGWSWQIEHEHHINRGYVYASQSISDEAACEEFLGKNPKAPKSPRVVKFRSGRYRRMWVDNVLAIGNSGGFVEPLEATALTMVCSQCHDFIGVMQQCALKPTPTMQRFYNDHTGGNWDEIRDFLGLHYALNTRLDTPFWRHCIADTDIGRLAPLLEFYDENGPSGIARHLLPNGEHLFGVDGYLVMLIGNKRPYSPRHNATPRERQLWNAHREFFAAQARAGMDVREALVWVRHPNWRWHSP